MIKFKEEAHNLVAVEKEVHKVNMVNLMRMVCPLINAKDIEELPMKLREGSCAGVEKLMALRAV